MVVSQPRPVTPEEHNELLDVWRAQVDRARRGQEADRNLARRLARESADAYEDFLGSVFFYYGENAGEAGEYEEGTGEG
jgi:hypothetical protein